MVEVDRIVIHQPNVPHRIGMNINSIGKVAYNVQKTGFLKNELAGGMVPTTYQTTAIYNPAKVFVLSQFQRDSVLFGEITLTVFYSNKFVVGCIVKGKCIIICQKPVVFGVVNEKVL